MKDRNEIRWYVVASRTEVGIYVDQEDRNFHLITLFFNSDGRLSETNLDSDRPGSGLSSAGRGTIRHGLDRRFNRYEHVAVLFSKQVSDYLELMRKRQRYDRLVLVAEPRFLGILKKQLSRYVRSLVVAEVKREYVTDSIRDLRSWILKGERENEDRAYI